MRAFAVMGLGVLLSGCPLTRAAWMADESDRIDREMLRSASQVPGEKDPALAGLAMGPEAPPLASAHETSDYAITPPSQRRPSRLKSAPPRAKGRGRSERVER